MPRYIGFTPQFDPISLQDYLYVPAMVIEGRQKEADKIEQYKDEAEKWRALMGDSPEAQAIWNNYNNALTDLGDNFLDNRTGDLIRAGRKMRDAFRDIKYRAEDAKTRRDKDLERQAKDPNLIGTIGDFMTYYNNPDYSTPMFDGSELQKNLDSVAKNIASTLPINRIGFVDPETEHDIIYEKGLTPEQKSVLLQDALSSNPQSREGMMLRNALASSGLDLNNRDLVRQASRFIDAGTRALDINRVTSPNPKFRTVGQKISDASASLDLESKRENYSRYGSASKPSDAYEDYNVSSVDGADWKDPKNAEAASKGLTIIPKGKGYAVIKKYDPSKKKWVAVQKYTDGSGKEHKADIGGMFVIPASNKEATKSTIKSVVIYDKKGNETQRLYGTAAQEHNSFGDEIQRGEKLSDWDTRTLQKNQKGYKNSDGSYEIVEYEESSEGEPTNENPGRF